MLGTVSYFDFDWISCFEPRYVEVRAIPTGQEAMVEVSGPTIRGRTSASETVRSYVSPATGDRLTPKFGLTLS